MKKFVAILVCLCMISDLLALELTYPFLPFMVRHFGFSDESSGTYIGLIGSSFGIGQFLSGWAWGRASNRFGRKIPLVVGLIGNMIAMIAFGFSSKWYMAAVIQFIQGTLNGNFGIMFTVIQDYYKGTAMSQAFGYVGLAYGIGLSLATAIGGTLAQPADKYPATFENFAPFVDYPFLFPCVISALWMLFVIVMVLMFLPETHPDFRVVNDESPLMGQKDASSDVEDVNITVASINEDAVPSSKPDKTSSSDSSSSDSSPPAQTDNNNHDNSADEVEDAPYKPSSKLWTGLTVLLCAMMAIHWWCMFGFMQMLGAWTSLNISEGGLGFSSSEIAGFFAFWGILLLPFYLIIWPHMISRKFRAWHVIMLGLSLDAIHFAAYPFINDLARSGAGSGAVYVLLLVEGLLGVFAINIYYLAIQIIINCSVTPDIVGSINGLVTTSMALGKAVAPATSGVLFSWTLSQSVFPIDFHMLFLLFGLSQVIAAVLAYSATRMYPRTMSLRVG